MNLGLLRRIRLLEGVPDDELERLAARAEEVFVPTGEVLMEEGSLPDAMYVVLEGEFEVSKRSGAQSVQLNRCGAGEPLGEMALVAHRPRSATVRALTGSRLIRIDEQAFADLLASPGAAEAILRTVMGRLENQEVQLRQHAKMAALGTLTAGLLHELNNPAAAVARGLARLEESLTTWRRLTASLAAAGADLEAVSVSVDERSATGTALDPLERADAAEELEDWLGGHAVEDPWALGATLADLGWRRDELESALDGLPVVEASQWVSLMGELGQVLAEAREGAGRISEIVAAVKDHSRSDEAPVQDVDVHRGLESALVLLRHKLRDGITVVREFAPGLPAVEGYPAELNQVWVNLIDNAVDAMNGRGELRLRTSSDDQAVTVEVIDTGTGIAAEVLDRIFEPFFTTKPVGQGSGIGLATSFKIVNERHGGAMRADSEPGRTRFSVRLPKRLA